MKKAKKLIKLGSIDPYLWARHKLRRSQNTSKRSTPRTLCVRGINTKINYEQAHEVQME